MQRTIILSLILILAVLVAGGYVVQNKYPELSNVFTGKVSNMQLPTSIPIIDLAIATPVAVATPNPGPRVAENEFTYAGWIANFGSEEGFKTLQNEHQNFTEISPSWYSLQADGSLKNERNKNAVAVSTYAKSKNIKVVPMIAMFDHEILSKVLNNPTNFERHITSILTEVDKYNYDGIDLDYESTKLADKELFFQFLSRLSTEMKTRNKKLIFTAVAQWGDGINYNILKETRKVQNWTEIAPYVDQIRLMVYDFTFSKSQFPGPIAPMSWVRQVVAYATTKAPANKFVLGIPTYSYEWWVEKGKGDPDVLLDYTTDIQPFDTPRTEAARSYQYAVNKAVVAGNKGKLEEFEDEQFFRYQKTNSTTKKVEDRMLVFLNPENIQTRVELAKTWGFSGVAFWRLGNDDALYENIRQ